MKSWAIIAAVVLTAPALAQNTDCRSAMTQMDLNMCAGREYQAADDAMNQVYRGLLAAQQGDTARLRAAQRAWIDFRDSECRYQTASSEGGSIHPMEYTGCLTTLTKARTKELRKAMACFREAERC
jgi:uncharacterized protein YecT (DUF1311 family)